MEIGERIKKTRNSRGLSTNALSRMTGISQSTISKLENGKRKADVEILEKIATALNVSTDRLTGESASCLIEDRLEEIGMTFEEVAKRARVPLVWLENLDQIIPGSSDDGEQDYAYITRIAKVLGLQPGVLRAALARQEIPVYDGFKSSPGEDFAGMDFHEIFPPIEEKPNVLPLPLPQNTHRIPVLGKIPAGIPLEAVEDIIGWEEIPSDWLRGGREYFALHVFGDSMYPEYIEGDIVIVRRQDCCESGDDCVVIVNGTDATLKRVHRYPDHIEIEALNPMYGKRKFTNEEVAKIPITILGVVVELRRKKKQWR